MPMPASRGRSQGCCARSGTPQADHDREAVARSFAKGQLAAMGAHHIADDGEAEARSGAARRVEWLRHALPFRNRNARPVVDHTDDSPRVVGADMYFKFAFRPMLQGIVNEVGK